MEQLRPLLLLCIRMSQQTATAYPSHEVLRPRRPLSLRTVPGGPSQLQTLGKGFQEAQFSLAECTRHSGTLGFWITAVRECGAFP